MATKRRSSNTSNTPSKATPARRAALALTAAVREQDSYLSTLAPRILGSFNLSPADKAFAHLLAQGVVSLQITLDTLIDKALRSPRDIKADVRDALRIAAYEILYLHKEDHAAVDQGVELVRLVAPRATGVANHVLHRIVEAKDEFPFGDPTRAVDAARLFYGFPTWLGKALEKDLGAQEALGFMAESVEAAPVWFAPNLRALSLDELARVLDEAGMEYNTCYPIIEAARPVEPAIFQLVDRSDVGSEAFLHLLREEKIVVSDLSAQSITALAVSTLPAHRARVLEIGAGRGTKTIQLQSLCASRDVDLEAYEVVDVKAKKVKQLEARMEQAGGIITQALVHDATKPFPHELASFDLVFIDAPCTGVGTLRRHPEIKARLNKKDSQALARIGSTMLEQASALVKPGAALVYSTCTVFKEEDEKVIEGFLASPAGSAFGAVAIGANGRTYFKTPIEPHGPDQHFAALLRRKV